MLVLQQAARLSDNAAVRFAALVHDLGKGITPQAQWPKHLCHEENGVALVQTLCERVRTPAQYRDLAVLVTRYHLHYHRAGELTPSTFLKVLRAIDAFRRPERVEQFVLACEADARGRPGYENKEFKQGDIFRAAYTAAAQVDTNALTQQGLQGTAFADQLTKLRIQAIAHATAELLHPPS
jgi:tRNA nucleotidyltransferase (CCA-adding enzyme)